MKTLDIIVKPIITEKSMADAGLGKFTFQVKKSANKNLIRKAIEEKFKVNVLAVSTSTVRGKKRRFGKRRTEVESSDWKKAIVKLKEGEKIGLFEVGG